jgi:hypothetical protein
MRGYVLLCLLMGAILLFGYAMLLVSYPAPR